MSLHEPLPEALEARGISRRKFAQFCSAMVAALALPDRYLGAVMDALEKTDKPVLVWLEFQDCAGNTESMLRSSDPTVADIVLELLSWEYHETIMAGAGKQAEAVLDRDLIRTKVSLVPETVREVRVVDIVGLDKQADGGTHVRSTGEVGRITVLKTESKGKGNKRIRIAVVDA